MTITVQEAFERGTHTFNTHDLAGFVEVLEDDVVFVAPGGIRGKGMPACLEFYGRWLQAFPDAHAEVHPFCKREQAGPASQGLNWKGGY
jgi:hypothetical protein